MKHSKFDGANRTARNSVHTDGILKKKDFFSLSFVKFMFAEMGIFHSPLAQNNRILATWDERLVPHIPTPFGVPTVSRRSAGWVAVE